jgi:hypothetical protein
MIIWVSRHQRMEVPGPGHHQGVSTMPLIDWSEMLSVQVEAIDSRPKRLNGLINEVHDATTRDK